LTAPVCAFGTPAGFTFRPNAATESRGNQEFVIEVGDALDFFVALIILRGLHRRILAAQFTND